MEKAVFICDACGRELLNLPVLKFRVVLGRSGWRTPKNLYSDIDLSSGGPILGKIPVDIPTDFHFCDDKCLQSWALKDFYDQKIHLLGVGA